MKSKPERIPAAPELVLDGDVEQSEEFIRRVYSPEALRLSEIEWLAHAKRVRDELAAKK
jgi:hypothetical protein